MIKDELGPSVYFLQYLAVCPNTGRDVYVIYFRTSKGGVEMGGYGGGYGSNFALILVLFILLVIVGAFYGY